ncbi:MAG: hypothetical protein HRT88_15780, partial [Lentisphaeraceae bacterium]|nr:hypothetical protein [Lentisphaeraceae bacterium]
NIDYADIKLFLCQRHNRSTKPLEKWQQFSQKYKDDETVQGIYVYMLSQSITDQEQFDDKLELIKKAHPLLAITAITNAARRKFDIKPEYFDYCAQIIKDAQSDEDVNTAVIASLISAESLPEKYKKSFTDKMLELYYNKDNKTLSYGYRGGAYQVLQPLIANGDYGRLIELMNFEVNKIAGKPSKNSAPSPYSFYSHYGRHNRQKFIHALPFPPQNLPGIPMFIKQLFRTGRHVNFGGSRKGIDKEKLVTYIAKIESPLLRLIIADYCDKTELAEKSLQFLIDPKKKSLSDKLIAAAWYGSNEQADKAIEILLKAKKLCSKKSETKKVHAAILAYAQDSKDKKTKAIAKQSAERLLTLRLTLQEKGELAANLELLGLTEFAAVVDQQIDKAVKRSKASSSTVSRSRGSSRSRDPLQKIRDLFDKSKEVDGLKMAVREYRKYARTALTIQTNGNNSQWQMNSLLSYIKQKNKSAEFIALLNPTGTTALARKILERALANELLELTDAAIKDYQQALKANDSSKMAHLRLSFLLSAKGDKTAGFHFKKAVGKNLNSSGQMISTMVNNIGNKPNSLNIYPLITEIFNETKTSKGQIANSMHWIQNVISRLENNISSDDVRLPGLFQKQDISSSKNEPKAKEISAKRIKVYSDICKASLRFAASADYAFGRLDVLMTRGDIPDTDRFECAQKAVIAKLNGNVYYSSQHSIYVNNVSKITRSAESIIIEHAFTKNKMQEVEALLNSLKSKGRQLKAKITRLKPLYECSEAEFIKKVSAFVIDKKNHTNGSEDQALVAVIEVRNNRAFKVSFTDLILVNFKKLFKNNSRANGALALAWSETLCAESNKAELRKYLQQSFSLFAPKITELKKKYPQNFFNQAPVGYTIRTLVQNISNPCLTGSMNDCLILLDILSSSGLSSEKELFRHTNLSHTLRNKFDKLSSDYKEIKSSSLLKELNDFNPIILPEDNSEASSFLKAVVKHAHNNSKDRQELIKKLKTAEKQTFGVTYVATLISSSHAKDVYKFLDGHLSEFLKLPQIQQDAFINALVQVMADYKYRTTAKNASGPFFDMLTARTAVSAGDRYKEFLKKEVAQDQYGYQKAAYTLVNQLVENDYGKAKTV